MIPDMAVDLIETWRLGFVASADADGRVNLSPKGTFVVLNDRQIAFAEMRSPQTLANIAVRSEVEVNFVDVLTRRGVRLRGDATAVPRSDPRHAGLLPCFAALWPDLTEMMNAVVVIDVAACKPLSSPAYDTGISEDTLRGQWAQKIKEISAC